MCEIFGESTESCTCNNVLHPRKSRFKSVNSSAPAIFDFPDLQAHTLYCLQSIANYSVVEQLKSAPEMTAGRSASIRTNGEM